MKLARCAGARWLLPCIVGVVSLLVSATIAVAQERTRVDLYREDSSRKGYAIVDEKTGRIDTYDKESKRTGYGVVRPDGRVDFYRPDGSRAGSGRTDKRSR